MHCGRELPGLDYGFTLTAVLVVDGSGTHRTTLVTTTLPDQNQSTAATWPAYPLDYYAGGVAGVATLPVPPAPATSSTGGVVSNGVTLPTAGTPLCSRVMPQGQTSPVNFVGSIARTSGVSYSYQWAFGDGVSNTAGAGVFNDSHIYTATQPAGGWTAVLTVTASGDGVTYSGTSTATCSLRVDFANPGDSQPGSANGSGSDSSNCPSGWGWLNPAAIVAIAPCLFIPSSATTDSLGTVAAQAKNTVPFSYVIDVASFLPAAVSQMNATFGAGAGQSQGCIGGFGGSVDAGHGNSVQLGYGNGGSNNQECLDARLGTIGGGLGHASGSAFGIDQLRAMMLLIVMAGFALGIWKLVARTIG